MVQHLRSIVTQKRWRSLLSAFSGTVVLTSVVVAGVVVILRQVGALESAELTSYDDLIQQRPSTELDERVLVVGITEADIQTRNEFPIEDGTLAQLLEIILKNEPRTVGIDIARDVPQGTNRSALLQQLQESDRTAVACVLSSTEEPGIAPPAVVPPDRVGFADFPQDKLGVIRRHILISTPAPSNIPVVNPSICSEANPDNQVPSLSLLLSLMYLESEGVTASITDADELQLGPTVFRRLSPNSGGYQNADTSDYQILLNYGDLDSIRQVTLTDVLEERIDPQWVRDRIVLIGYTSAITKDSFFTPLSGDASQQGAQMPGVVIHAHAVSQILGAVLDQRPLLWCWAEGIEILWILGWAALGGALAGSIPKTIAFIVAEAALLGVLYGTCYLLFLNGGWVPLVPAAIALVASAVGVILVDRATRGGYTRAIYEQMRDQVKVVLKPKIEIDQEKRAKQVSEITESSYFQDLMERAKTIREKRIAEEAQQKTPPVPDRPPRE